MKTIWKFPLASQVAMPIGAEILTVQAQRGEPMLWAIVYVEESVKQVRHFSIVGTGQPLMGMNSKYIGTFQIYDGDFVGHVFEELL